MKQRKSRKPASRRAKKVLLADLPRELRGCHYALSIQGHVIEEGEIGELRYGKRGATFIRNDGSKICAFADHTAVAHQKGSVLVVLLNCGKVLTIKHPYPPS